MKKKLIVILLSALVVFSAASCSLIPKKLSVSDYFPFTQNIHKVFKGTGNEFAGYETYVDYVNNDAIQIRKINDGTTSVSVYIIKDSALIKVYFEGESYYRLDRTAKRDSEEILIKEPLKKGTAWTLSDGSKREITAVDMSVTVPNGAYKAIEITTTGNGYTQKDYYASGIGLIKSEFTPSEDPNAKITSELQSVQQGAALKQAVRFYYPDFNNDKLVYVNKDIELKTGDNILSVFQAQFRQAPYSDLKPLMSANTAILGIDYDTDKQIVTADFSKQFISEMNAGSSLESMILKCTADTLGNYFGTNKIIITIEGQPYSSGAILFKSGEYMLADWSDILEYQSK